MAERGALSEFSANLRLVDHHRHGLAVEPPSPPGHDDVARRLMASTGIGLSELYACGAAMWRRAMSRIFGEWLDEGLISLPDARRYAEWVAAGNADRVHGPDPA